MTAIDSGVVRGQTTISSSSMSCRASRRTIFTVSSSDTVSFITGRMTVADSNRSTRGWSTKRLFPEKLPRIVSHGVQPADEAGVANYPACRGSGHARSQQQRGLTTSVARETGGERIGGRDAAATALTGGGKLVVLEHETWPRGDGGGQPQDHQRRKHGNAIKRPVRQEVSGHPGARARDPAPGGGLRACEDPRLRCVRDGYQLRPRLGR